MLVSLALFGYVLGVYVLWCSVGSGVIAISMGISSCSGLISACNVRFTMVHDYIRLN